jgi:hypothetical protein
MPFFGQLDSAGRVKYAVIGGERFPNSAPASIRSELLLTLELSARYPNPTCSSEPEPKWDIQLPLRAALESIIRVRYPFNGGVLLGERSGSGQPAARFEDLAFRDPDL